MAGRSTYDKIKLITEHEYTSLLPIVAMNKLNVPNIPLFLVQHGSYVMWSVCHTLLVLEDDQDIMLHNSGGAPGHMFQLGRLKSQKCF